MPETADSPAEGAAAAASDAMAHTAESDTAPKPAGERRRPRKKLSFREPEIVGCEKYRQMKERSAAESIIKSGRGEAEGAAEPAEPPGPRRHQDGGQERQTNGEQDRRQQKCQQNGQPEGGDGLLPERQRGGSLDSQLSVRLVLRPGAAGVTSIETETPPAPARHLADSTRLGSMEDLDLQDEALQIVRSVDLAFEMSQCLGPGTEPPEVAADTTEEPGPPACPDQLSAESPSSASGDDTPQQTDDVNNATPEQSNPQPPFTPGESATPEATPPPASRSPEAGGSSARERSSRRQQRLSRSPDKRHLPPAAPTRRYHSVPRLPRGGVRGVQPLSPLVARHRPLLDHLSEPWADRRAEPASLYHQIQLVCSQLAQQRQQTQATQAQVSLVRHQLQAETAARLQAQRRSHQLLEHNRQLLEHVQELVGELQQLQADQSQTVSPDTSFASLSSEEAGRTEPDPSLQLLWDLERLSGGVSLSALGQYSPPAPQYSTLERLGGGPLPTLGQYSPLELARFGPEPLFDLGPFSSAPPSPLSRTDPLLSELSELGGGGFVPLSPLAMEEVPLLTAGPLGGRSPLSAGRRRHHGPGPGSGGTLRRSGGHHRHTASARHAPPQ